MGRLQRDYCLDLLWSMKKLHSDSERSWETAIRLGDCGLFRWASGHEFRRGATGEPGRREFPLGAPGLPASSQTRIDNMTYELSYRMTISISRSTFSLQW